jgi:hypothetical protein
MKQGYRTSAIAVYYKWFVLVTNDKGHCRPISRNMCFCLAVLCILGYEGMENYFVAT